MNDYIVVKEVRLKITAKNRKEAASFASNWTGETSSGSTDGSNIEWNGKSKRVRVEDT